MRNATTLLAASAAALLAAGCSNNPLAGRDSPDEFAVARNAPLVIPPDYALTPPRPGEPQAIGADARAQALQALFGGPAPRSQSEQQLLSQVESDRAAPGARSIVGDSQTNVVDKGQVTQTILAVPEGDDQTARVSTPQ